RRRTELVRRTQEADAKQAALTTAEELMQATTASAAELRARLDALRAEVIALAKQARAVRKPTVVRRHYPTAVAERVARAEYHYRCLNGRVVDTRLDYLLELVRKEVTAHDFNKNPVRGGSVGPIDGFRLIFAAAKPDAGLDEQLRDPFSGGVELGAWKLSGDSDSLGETQEDALAEGSRFRLSIAAKSAREHSITLWVYPDGFEIASAVRNWLHESGFQVALRPLPFGVPIAGSPDGSASHSQ
ncbi:MAG: hypothetical protein ACRDD1_15155, partial [Planctomycetia bacterium]